MASLLDAAVANNAQWCDGVCRHAGLPVAADRRLWWTAARSPDNYPDAVTLKPGASGEEILAPVDSSPGCSVKDSFSDLDLRPWGFRVLFDARWVSRAPGDPERPLGMEWRTVSSPSEHSAWADGHGAASAIGLDLVGPDLQLLTAYRHGRLVAGAALSVAGEVVGVSNLFALEGNAAEVWADVVTVASRSFPGLTMVGYEQGEDLAVAAVAGFVPLGPLRVWMLWPPDLGRAGRSGGAQRVVRRSDRLWTSRVSSPPKLE